MMRSLGIVSEKQPQEKERIHLTYPVFHWHIYLGLFYSTALLPGLPVLKKVEEGFGREEDLIWEARIWVLPS